MQISDTMPIQTPVPVPAGPGKVVPAGPGKVVQAGPGWVVVPAGRGTGHWRTYDVTDGLAEIVVWSIFQDQEGNLWFGTYNGVSRYNGKGFINFTTRDGLADNWVRSILQDRKGHLWFGTYGGGVSRYDPSAEPVPSGVEGLRAGRKGFTNFTTRDGLADNYVRSILQDREGHLWFGTEGGGVSRYDGKSFTTFTTQDGLAHNRVYSTLQDREGNLYFGTEGGVSRYDPSAKLRAGGKTWTTFTTKDGLGRDTVLSIFQDREGNLWFGTDGGGVSQFDGHSFSTFTAQNRLGHNVVISILQDQEGNLWFGTWGGGVSRYDGKSFVTFTAQNGLASNQAWSILQDREGYLWFGTRGGVSRYDGKSFTAFTAQDGLAHNEVRSILQDRDGNFWFGTNGGGVSRYDGKSFTTFVPPDGLAHNEVWSIFQDQEGHLWFGTYSGVSRYNGKSFTTFTTQDGLAHNEVRSILQDREGHLWFGTWGGGVSRYDGESFTTFTTQDGLAHNEVRSILQDWEGYLWFGTYSGVSRYDGESFTTFTTQDGLAHNRVFSILQDRDGHLWFGTGDGVSRYGPSTEPVPSGVEGLRTGGKSPSASSGQRFTTFTTQDGLAHNRVFSILQDRDGHLWFGTSGGGVSRYDGQCFQTMLQQDGLAGNLVWLILQDRVGDLWFGTNNGVARFRPPAPSPPLVSIDAVLADRRYEKALEITIPTSVRLTTFEFHGMSFKTRPDAMVYRYRLKGYDADWKTTRSRRVEYHDLPVGDYTFEVLAVDRDLVYSEQPATVSVTVTPDPRIEALTEALSGAAGEFVGTSEALRKVQTQLSWVAQTDVVALILGETGTGKGLAARAVHAMGERRGGPFIQVNCGAIPEGLVESELFGHEKGAFTGATSRKLGKVEVAAEGTLFLDEIGDMPIEAQTRLLRLLEERTFERVGGTQTLKAEARVIAATNRDLKRMVSEGKFREDLYFRITTFPIQVPPLRERREDIPLLAAYFMERMAAHLNKQVLRLSSEALALLRAYDWPGNVRELEHAVQRAVIVCRGSAVQAKDITLEFGRAGSAPAEEAVTLEEHERRYIQSVLDRTGWAIRGPHGAAAILGLHEATLRSRMKKLGILRPQAG